MLYEGSEQFKDLLCMCPHHRLQKWMMVQTFYNGVTQPVQSTIDVVTSETLMNKTKDVAYSFQ